MSAAAGRAGLAATAPALTRDRLTWLAYLQIALWAFFLYGFGPTVPLLRDELGVSSTLSGLHGPALALGAILAGLAGTQLVARLGRRVVLWGAVFGLAAGTAGYVTAGSLPLTLTAAFVAGTAGAVLLNTVNAVLADTHGASAPAALSEANAGAGLVGTVAPLVVGGAVAVGLGWRAGLLVTVGLAAALFAVFSRTPLPPPLVPPGGRHTPGARTLPSAYWVTWAVLVCVIAVEFCLSLWSGDLLRSRFTLPDGVATASWAGVLAGMTVTRLMGSRWTRRYAVDDLLTASMLVLLVGFGVFWTAPWALLAVAGLFVTGLGMGLLYPLTVSRALAVAGGRTDLASARASLGAGLAVGLGPFALGALADTVGIRAGFLLVPGLVLLALALLRGPGRVSATS